MQRLFPSRSGISAFVRTARPSFAATTRRAVRPASLNFRAPALSRFASTAGVGDGKIYQVIGKLSRLDAPSCARGGPGKLFHWAWLTAQTQQVPSSMVSSSVAQRAPVGSSRSHTTDAVDSQVRYRQAPPHSQRPRDQQQWPEARPRGLGMPRLPPANCPNPVC